MMTREELVAAGVSTESVDFWIADVRPEIAESAKNLGIHPRDVEEQMVRFLVHQKLEPKHILGLSDFIGSDRVKLLPGKDI